MKVLQINSVYGVGSTGRIVKDISDILIEKGHVSYVAYGCGTVSTSNIYRMESRFYQKINILKTRFFGKHGFYNKIATYKLLRWIDGVNPDVIHLHNIHGHYINVKMLFKYLKKIDKPVIWTLHDCWAFTGHCTYFDYEKCYKWEKGCSNCPQRREYPDSWFFDRSKKMWKEKKKIFTEIEKMTIVTPSNWLANYVKKSFLGKYPVEVINNGIELLKFKPTKSNLLDEKLNPGEKIVLCVASEWGRRKGFFLLNDLASKLSSMYRLVVVGIEEGQKKQLDGKIIAINRTNNLDELVMLYSKADYFVNLTLEDNYPTVNLESLACGTPVITFNTGGSPESINEDSGKVVEKGNVNAIIESLKVVRKEELREKCVKHAQIFDKKIRFAKYIELYEEC